MKRRLPIVLAGLALMAVVVDSTAAQDASWTGWVSDSMCGARGDNERHASCAKKCVKDHGAKFVLYNPSDKKVYVLDPQDKLDQYAGKQVKVTGKLDGDKIKVTAIEAVPKAK